MLDKDLVEQYFIPLSPIPTGISPQGTIDVPLQCILFDLYGTLFISDSGDIDSMHIGSAQSEKIRHLLETYQINKDADHLIIEYKEAISREHRNLKKKGIDFPEVEVDRIWMEITHLPENTVRNFATEFQWIVSPAFPMPHLKELLTACRHSRIPMGIISNAQFYSAYLFHWFLGGSPEQLGFHKDLIFYSYASGYAKPSLHMFYLAAKRLKEMGIADPSVLYLGNDMGNDILPAKTAGFKTALFAGDLRSLKLRDDEPACKNLYPDIIITALNQLIPYV